MSIYSKIKRDTPDSSSRRQFIYDPGKIEFWVTRHSWGEHLLVDVDWGGISLEERSDVELLNYSIAKWRFVVDELNKGTHLSDGGSRSCALCMKYIHGRNVRVYCHGCPIYKNTGEKHCNATPYGRYAAFRSNRFIKIEETASHAEDMLSFLVKLRDNLLLEEGKKSRQFINQVREKLERSHIHVLKFKKFMNDCEGVGAFSGKAAIKCEDCGKPFAIEYMKYKENNTYGFTLYAGETTHKIVLPISITENTAIGIE